MTLTPVNRAITIASGGTALVGRTTAINPPVQAGGPAWLTAANPAIGQWIEIPGTVLPRKTIAESFSGMTVTPSGRIIAGLNGGHTDGNSNDTYGIDLAQNVPAWTNLCPASPNLIYEQPYQPDGKPSARHNYYTQQYMLANNRVMLAGCIFVALSGNSSFPTIDGFDLATNTWDAAGTWPYCGTSPYPGPTNGVYPKTGSPEYSGGSYAAIGGNGVDTILLNGGTLTFNVLTKTFTPLLSANFDLPRSPWAYDSLQQEFFGMCFGDGQGYSLNLGIVAARRKGSTIEKITFNASAGVTQLTADIPLYAGETFDATTGKYYFYCGISDRSQAGRVYEITPNSGTVWDMRVLPTSGSITPVHPSGLNNRFQYIQALGGIVCLPDTNTGVFFMRTH